LFEQKFDHGINCRKELQEICQRQLASWQSKTEADKQKKQEELARRQHFLLSTAVIPGIYNSPHRVRVELYI